MKILKILGIIVLIIVVLKLLGFFSFYYNTFYYNGSAMGGMYVPQPEDRAERRSCVGIKIVVSNTTSSDGGVKLFCAGLVKTKTITYQ